MAIGYNWIGERLDTNITDQTMLEHLHRYAIALESVSGKKVLDIACGEGYGVSLLAKKASHVTGIDIDKATIEKAKKKYSAHNITFNTGSIMEIPAKTASIDVITCFETLEHLEEHDKILGELKRVLAPGGLLLISTPEKENYSGHSGSKNLFHKKELYGPEFKSLLNSFFAHTFFCRQVSCVCSVVQPEDPSTLEKLYTGNFTEIQSAPTLAPGYWICLASDKNLNSVPASLFHHQKSFMELLQEELALLRKTTTYRAGNLLLSPFKFVRNLFRK